MIKAYSTMERINHQTNYRIRKDQPSPIPIHHYAIHTYRNILFQVVFRQIKHFQRGQHNGIVDQRFGQFVDALLREGAPGELQFGDALW